MEEIDSSPLVENPRKRAAPDEDSPEKKTLNLKGTQFMMPTPPETDQSSNASPNCNDASAREVSPAPSSTTLSSIETMSTNPPVQSSNTTVDLTSSAPVASTSGPPPKKRRKLTPAEKEAQAAEKARKDRVKAEEKARKEVENAEKKARKDEEKARKDEEKRTKDEEKRKKAEEREAEKRVKELEAERKVQEKMKKERNQMRLGAFFQKPATPAKESGDFQDDETPYNRARRKSWSLEPFDAVKDQIRRSESPCKGAAQPLSTEATPAKPVVSDYKRYFLPFELQTHTTMPHSGPLRDPEQVQELFDLDLDDASLPEKYDLGIVESYVNLEHHFADFRDGERGRDFTSVRKLWDRLQGSIQEPIDLTDDDPPLNVIDEMQEIPRRYIEFGEDVRPAYFGTYTKIRASRSSRKVSRNPFERVRPDTDYDYDSEAEWVEPEEGEELLDEEDNEAESVGDANEFDEFLDDEEDEPKKKRKLIPADLEPVSTGLYWEDECGKIVPSIEGGSPLPGMRDMRIGCLIPGFTGQTIDPFSTAYWESEKPAVQAATTIKTEQSTQAVDTNGSMPPPRQPLQTRPNSNGTLDHLLVSNGNSAENATGTTSAPTSKPVRKSVPKPLSTEDLEEFKGFVIGKTSSKADILKELKTRSVAVSGCFLSIPC